MLVYRVPLAAYLEKKPFFLAPEPPTENSADLFILPALCKPHKLHFAAPSWQVELDKISLILPKEAFTEPPVFISAEISGGTLKDHLENQFTRYASRLWLVIRPSCRIFPIPCQDGQGEALVQNVLQPFLQTHPSFYAEDFCCRYLIDFQDENPKLILYDTPETVEQKLALAASLGIGQAVVFPFRADFSGGK